MTDVEELAARAVERPIRATPPIAAIRSAVARRRRRRRAIGGLAAVGLVIAGAVVVPTMIGGTQGSGQVETVTGSPTPPEPTASAEDNGLDPPQTVAPDEGLTQNEAASTPARLLREIETINTDHDNEVPPIRWRLTERGTEAGRCLEVAAIVDSAVHSRGGTCHRLPDPSPGSWDLEPLLRFELPGQAFLVLFGRAGADVASVQLSDPFPSHDTDVDGAWMAVVLAADDGTPYQINIEAFDSSGSPLLAERVPVDPIDAPTLNTNGLIAELQIADAVTTEVPTPAVADDSIPPFFMGRQRVLCADGQRIDVYEYDTVNDRLADSTLITSDGQLRGPETAAFVSWIGPPRFFAAGDLIALHLSNDPETLSLLTKILGPTLSPDVNRARGTGNPPCDND